MDFFQLPHTLQFLFFSPNQLPVFLFEVVFLSCYWSEIKGNKHKPYISNFLFALNNVIVSAVLYEHGLKTKMASAHGKKNRSCIDGKLWLNFADRAQIK